MTSGRPLVYLRIRPPITDSERNEESFCEVNSSEATIGYTKATVCIDGLKKIKKAAKFDQIFDTDSTQADIFEALWPKILATFESGFSSTVLMYGATGSGKTFTMDGKLDESSHERIKRGICPRSIEKIFHFLENNAESDYEVQLRYVEAYNDKVYDLLNKSPNNEVNVQKALKWTNELDSSILKSHENFNSIYFEALKKRTTAANNSNKESSRSHSIVHIKVVWTCKNGGMKTPRKGKEKLTSEIFFVDLAGAEKYKKKITNKLEEKVIEELRNQEGICINKALSALSFCVSQLNLKSKECNKRKKINIPFLSNILTKLLSSSFNGNNALMLVLCIPNIKSLQLANRKTIDFGLRCLELKVELKKNEIFLESDLVETIDGEDLLYTSRELESREAPLEEERIINNFGRVDDTEEVELLKEKLTQLTMCLIEKEYELSLLNETDAELEECKQQLLDMKKYSEHDKNRIISLENRIEEKTKSLNQLSEINKQLKFLIEKMENEKVVLKEMQDAEKNLSSQILENNSAELQNNLYLSLSQISLKEEEIEKLKKQILEVRMQKESAESLANTILKMLERKMGFELDLGKLQTNVKELEDSIKELKEIFEKFAESNCTLTKESETTLNSLKNRYNEIERELTAAKESEALMRKKVFEVSDQIENAIIVLPTELQVKARKDILEYNKKSPSIIDLKKQAKYIKDALINLGIDEEVSIMPNRVFENDKKIALNSSFKSTQALAFNEHYRASENRELINEEIGNNLDDDLIRFRDLQHEDELYRYFSNLPYTAHELGKLLSLYRSFLPRFLSMNGIERIIKLMKTTKFNSTFSNLCFLLESALYNDESQDIANKCGIIEVIILKFTSEKWLDYDSEYKINTLDMIATLAKYEKNQLMLQEKTILSTITDFVFDNKVQKVISSSVKCLAEIFPTLDKMRTACNNFKVEELCAKIVQHCDNPSIYVQNASAMCIARFCSREEYQNCFVGLSKSSMIKRAIIKVNIVDYLIQRVTVNSDSSSSDSLSFALLSLISADNQNIYFSPDGNKTVVNKLYEALCTTHAKNLSKTILSLSVTGTSEKFPYHCSVKRGVWNWSDGIDLYSDGGSTYSAFFNKNPMFKLKIKSCSNNKFGKMSSVSITLLRENEVKKSLDNYYSEEESLSLKDVFCYAAVYSKKDIINNLKDTNCQNDGLLIDHLNHLWCSGQRFIFNSFVNEVDESDFVSKIIEKQAKYVGTVELENNEEYIIVPYKNVRSSNGDFILSVAGNCNIELEELQDKFHRKAMITKLHFPQMYKSHEFLGFRQADWRNFPQILVKSNVKSVIYVILSAKNFDDKLENFRQQSDEEYSSPHDLANDFNNGGYLELKIFKNSKYSQDRRYVESASHNVIANDKFKSRRQSIAAFIAEPGDTYSIIMALTGLVDFAESHSHSYRIQLISSEAGVEYTPVSSYNLEWKSFSTIFSFSLTSKAEHEIELAISASGDLSRNFTNLELSITLQATCEDEKIKVIIIDIGSDNILFDEKRNVNKGISSGYKEGNISLVGKNLSIKNGSGLLKIRLIRTTKNASNNEIFRIFGFSNLPIKLKNDSSVDNNNEWKEDGNKNQFGDCEETGKYGNASDSTHEKFKLVSRIPFYSYGYFEDDLEYLLPKENSDEYKYSGEYVKMDKSILQKLYDKISYQSAKLDEQASKIEILNTRVRPPFINESLAIIQSTLPTFLNRQQILLNLYNPIVEFIRDILTELNSTFGFAEGLFTRNEMSETMDPSMKLTFLKKIIMFISQLTSKNYLTLMADVSEIIGLKAYSQTVKACNIIIKVLCQEAKKDNDKDKWESCVQSTLNNLKPRGGGFKALQNLVK